MELPVIQRISTVFRTQRAEREFGIESLGRLLEQYLPDEHIEEVRRAATFARQMHSGQSRSSGEPYIYHPLAAARILAEMRMDHTTLMAAILHDVIEDTGISKESLALEFGKDVAELVDGVSKIDKIEGMSRTERQAESFRKLLLAMTQDLRVILVKLADRMHNMRTLNAMAPDKRRRIARETLDIYAPIAQRLGIQAIRTELEDLAFANLYPNRYGVLARAVQGQLGDTKKLIKEVESRLSTSLREEGIGASVVGRDKNIYSIYQKMRKKKLKLLKVMDLLGFRVIVSKVDDCYRALGVIHHVYKPVPGEFDDHIANSKANGYQSLHTTCIGPGGQKVEVQIRTRDMHHIAESGIAAHWQYKLGGGGGPSAPQLRAREWLNSLFDTYGGAGALDFVENVKVDLFPDEVYVFTPKGEIRRLPKGATPVDFAYSVHSELGNRCVAARVDGHLEPLSTPLKHGQTVQVITARHARPNAAWLNFVKTAKARSAIRVFLKNQHEDEAIRLGRRLLEIALRELHVNLAVLKDEPRCQTVLRAFSLGDMEELYASIGTGARLAPLVARHYLPDGHADRAATSQAAPLAIEGTEGLVLDYARCCRPIPGDDIRGHVSMGRGIVVHRMDCRHAKGRPQDWVPLTWADHYQGDYLAEVRMKALNKRGLLASVTGEIAQAEASIENVQMPEDVGGDVVETRFILSVRDRVHLARVIRRLRRVDSVERVYRP
ncbi:bifunctional (p)ppGpp synthetase/guanosine-3',5'-bis(diphosphate) 3'-pyrophosphohydrolase [Flagellatimonas centrodinii]|uniref:RelA/SpoT family protein n=1 Tax=Flagellatimonas centrodinii TaxID=2806210 RepID=UPI001FFBA100|nr:bifunctional (p)ppGpp synthetase/guanosine-3',5'-bis(diphosphate) 3'-pyrophosphohydrolase [Flagellatimonas centrodinii]ULQ45425.1 bifunctional (p)ppGpp synthetase/guanosine-3',5'-bis(diphosphate) 3'-pyrophosphohydrolase [Flagellatimonas centrodinii]